MMMLYKDCRGMLQDRILSRDEFSRLLGIRANTITQRIYVDEICFAFGCRINAHIGEYLLLDAVAVLGTSMFSREIGMGPAAEVWRETWDGEQGWLRAVQIAEDNPKLYAAEPIDRAHHFYLAVGVDRTKPGFAIVGTMENCGRQLSGYEFIRGISIQTVLRQLRTNSRVNKVALPERLTPPIGDPEEALWRREIESYQKLSNMRFKAKMKGKKASGKARVPA